MIPGYQTMTEATSKGKGKIPKSRQWLSAVVRLGHVKGMIEVGRCKFLPNSEVERLRKDPPKISREDFSRGMVKSKKD